MTKNAVAHDTVPYFMERFATPTPCSSQNFAQNVLHGRPAPVTIDDGIEAVRIAIAANRALVTGMPVDVASVTE